MYASNEDEDWVYLHKTPPVNFILQGDVNLVDHKRSNSSSSSSSITSCSSKSVRSVSLSSISSTELEHAQHENNIINTDASSSSTNDSINHHRAVEQENHLLETTNIEDPLLFSTDDDNNIQITTDTNLSPSQQLISTPIVNENEMKISHDSDNPSIETSTEANENDVLNTGFELSRTLSLSDSSESLSVPNDLRRRISVNTDPTDLHNSEIFQSAPISQEFKPQKRTERHQNRNDTLVFCTCIVILLALPFILGQIVTQWDQSRMNKIAKELDITNQRLNEVKNIPIGDIEEKITKQLEEKLQNMISQQLAWHDHEKQTFIVQIRELRQILNMTKQNLTNTIDQLTNENGRLQEQIKSLERRFGVAEEQHPKDTKTCPEGVDCTNSSSSTLNKLVSNIFKRTRSIAADTSINLSGLFEHLSASVSDLVDHRLECINKSKKKLTNFSGSSTAEKVQTSFRRSVETLSSSFRKAKLTYATWLKSRAQRREQTRMDNNEKDKQQQQAPKKYPWRWVFQRDHDRERMSYQKSTKEHVCHSKVNFPMSKICSMKDWMVKLFRP